MNRRLSVRLPEGLAWGLENVARSSGMTKSEIVREALMRSHLGIAPSPEAQHEALRLAAAMHTGEEEPVDAAALIREVRNEMEEEREPDAGAHRVAGRRRCEPRRPRVTPGFQR